MTNNRNRIKKIFEGVLPPKGTDEYSKLIDRMEKNRSPELDEFSKNSWKKVVRSLEAQSLSNCDLITEKTLRQFLNEFNSRAWEHGLRSMPMMFNVMQSFFFYRKPEIYFELLEEENYLISFFEFMDYVTSSEFKDNKSLLLENVSEDIIYNFNVGEDLEEIKYKTTDGDEYVIAGVSLIRRDNEITVLIIAGKLKTSDIQFDEKSFDYDTDNPDKAKMISEFQERVKKDGFQYVYLDEEEKYIKVLVAARVDLDTMTLDERLVAEETNLSFTVYTDNIDGFVDSEGNFVSDEHETTFIHVKERIEQHSEMFEVLQLATFLPHYFNLFEDEIIEEVLETEFKETYGSPISRRKFKNIFGGHQSNKPLYSIDRAKVFSSDVIKVREDLFKVQSGGYWKKLALDEIGSDKNDKPVRGRTWVTQNLAWFQAKERDLVIERNGNAFEGENAGFIYILRNPAMDNNIFKIGLTRNDVNVRAKQLSKTSVPDKFYKCQEWNVKDCVKAEKEVHDQLATYRVDPRREFFKIKYDLAIEVIQEVVERCNS